MRHESDYETAYEAARRRFMAGKPFAFRQPGEKFPRAMKSMTGSVFVDSNAEPITIKISMG
jgi:hypothetical protein